MIFINTDYKDFQELKIENYPCGMNHPGPTSLEQREEILCFLPLKSVVLLERSEAK